MRNKNRYQLGAEARSAAVFGVLPAPAAAVAWTGHQCCLSGREYGARILRGKLGGYRLHIDVVCRMMTVERLE